MLAEARPTLGDLGSRMPMFAWREILHPAYWTEDDEVVREVTWAEVARARGSDVHSAAHFDALVGLHINDFENGFDDPDGVWNAPPEQGTPLDRRWLVITDCDDWLTYVGAEADTIAALEGSAAFEVRAEPNRR